MTRQLDITPDSSSSYAGDFSRRALEFRALHGTRATRVYLIGECFGGDAMKIGIADYPEIRLQQLQRGNPNRLEVVGHFAGTPRFEAFIHRELQAYALWHEWFLLQGKAFALVRDLLKPLCELAEDMGWADSVSDTRVRLSDWAERYSA